MIVYVRLKANLLTSSDLPNVAPFTEDAEENRIPTTFPGCCMVSGDKDEHGSYLHPDYRRHDNLTPEFQYFLERIMATVSPYRNKFKERKGTHHLRKIFSVSDEAWGLVMLFNELHRWESDAKNIPKVVKKFCDGKNGRKQGWANAGIKLYNKLCKDIHKRRLEGQSITLERNIHAAYSKGSGLGRKEVAAADDSSSDESDYLDDTIINNDE